MSDQGDPIRRAKCDFGEALVVIGGVERKPTASSSPAPRTAAS